MALAMDMHFIIVSTLCFSPASKKTCEPPMDAAYSLTLTSSFNDNLPESMASNIRINVIIFVMLAGISSLSLSFSYMIVPVLPPIRTAASADMSVSAFACAVPDT